MAYNPEQPRIPKGNKGAGRWTKFLQLINCRKAHYIYGSPDKVYEIQQEIDKLVACLEVTETGEIVETEVSALSRQDLKKYNLKNGWGVHWSSFTDKQRVFGVFVKGDNEPQGLIALESRTGGMYINFLTSAPQNNKQLLRNSQKPKYSGVGGHLFAIAINESLKSGNFDGCVYGYAANQQLLEHYKKEFGAVHCAIYHPYQFFIDGENALNVIKKYSYKMR